MFFLEEPPQGGRAADFHTWHSGRHDWSGMQRSMGRAGVARAGIDSGGQDWTRMIRGQCRRRKSESRSSGSDTGEDSMI